MNYKSVKYVLSNNSEVTDSVIKLLKSECIKYNANFYNLSDYWIIEGAVQNINRLVEKWNIGGLPKLKEYKNDFVNSNSD